MDQLELFFSLSRCVARGLGLLIWLRLLLQMQAPTSSLRDTEDWWKLAWNTPNGVVRSAPLLVRLR